VQNQHKRIDILVLINCNRALGTCHACARRTDVEISESLTKRSFEVKYKESARNLFPDVIYPVKIIIIL
jgi:hypothetical protein